MTTEKQKLRVSDKESFHQSTPILKKLEAELEEIAIRRFVRRFWHVPLMLFQVWQLFFVFHVYNTLYKVDGSYQEYHYDNSLALNIIKTVDVMEHLIEGSRNNVSHLLPEQWPNGTYRMGYFGICRENEGSQKVCYKGSKTEDLVLKDIGIQIAEYNQMADLVEFGEKFKQKYRDLQDEVDEELQRRLRCRYTGRKEVCYHEGVTESDSNYLPNSARPKRFSFFINRIVLVFIGMSIGLSLLAFWIREFLVYLQHADGYAFIHFT